MLAPGVHRPPAKQVYRGRAVEQRSAPLLSEPLNCLDGDIRDQPARESQAVVGGRADVVRAKDQTMVPAQTDHCQGCRDSCGEIADVEKGSVLPP